MFVEIPGFGIFRDEKVNHREDIAKSAAISTLSKSLGVKPQQTVYYGTLGGANSSFILGKVLASPKADFYAEPGVGIRNVNRRPNELDVYQDDGTSDTATTWSLVSRIPGRCRLLRSRRRRGRWWRA